MAIVRSEILAPYPKKRGEGSTLPIWRLHSRDSMNMQLGDGISTGKCVQEQLSKDFI